MVKATVTARASPMIKQTLKISEALFFMKAFVSNFMAIDRCP
jgi:hypothetical protein